MRTRHEQLIQELLGEYLSLKLKNSHYSNKERSEQLAYMLGLTTELIAKSADNDNRIVNIIVARIKSNK